MYEIDESKPTPIEKASTILGTLGATVFNMITMSVIAMAMAVVVYLFLATPHQVVGRSMYPNFHNGDYLIANKVVYKIQDPQRGEVVIFKHSASEDYIKRIIGLPGDTVSLKDGKVYINGQLLDESDYLSPTVYTGGENYMSEGDSIVVPPDYYFVLGDNRPHSSDSRDFGPIARSAIKGRAWLIYYPFDRFRLIKHATYRS